MASLFAKKKNLDDCLIQNDRNNIIESSNSNLFIVSNGVLYTPTLDDGCIGGVMRMQIINLALEHKIKVYECNLTPQHLLAADEIFMSNAIQGIQWVSSYRTKRYFNEHSKKFIQILNNSISKG
jgi:branched-chain amino acid aminotransferase